MRNKKDKRDNKIMEKKGLKKERRTKLREKDIFGKVDPLGAHGFPFDTHQPATATLTKEQDELIKKRFSRNDNLKKIKTK